MSESFQASTYRLCQSIWLQEREWSKQRVREFLFERAQNPIGELRERGGWGTVKQPDFVDIEDDNAMMPIVPRAENIIVFVAGGYGRHMSAVLSAAYNLSVTRQITLRDGTPVKSVQEFLG